MVLLPVYFSYLLICKGIEVKYINFVFFYTYIFFILCYIFPVSMVVLDDNFALGCGPGTIYPKYKHFNVR